MKTLKDVKARVQVGTRLLCVNHNTIAKNVGAIRTVAKVGATYFVSTIDGLDKNFWTHWGKAKHLTIDDADTFTMGLCCYRNSKDPEVFVTLRFLEEK